MKNVSSAILECKSWRSKLEGAGTQRPQMLNCVCLDFRYVHWRQASPLTTWGLPIWWMLWWVIATRIWTRWSVIASSLKQLWPVEVRRRVCVNRLLRWPSVWRITRRRQSIARSILLLRSQRLNPHRHQQHQRLEIPWSKSQFWCVILTTRVGQFPVFRGILSRLLSWSCGSHGQIVLKIHIC